MPSGWKHARAQDLFSQESLTMKESGIPKWIVPTEPGVLVRFHIQPKASRSEVSGEYKEGDVARDASLLEHYPVSSEQMRVPKVDHLFPNFILSPDTFRTLSQYF